MRNILLLLILLVAQPVWGATDNFNRADNADLGALWDSGYPDRPAFAIVGQKARPTSLGQTSTETHNATLSDDQLCQVTLSTLNSGAAGGLLLRASGPPNQNFYRILANNGGTTVNLWPGDTDLASDSTPWASGDVLTVTVVGTTINVYRNGTLIPALTVSDATHSSGRCGMLANPGVNSLADVELENFISSGAKVYNDAFTQVDESPLSSSGAWLSGYSTGNVQVIGNQVNHATVGNYGAATVGLFMPTDAQYAQWRLSAFNSSSLGTIVAGALLHVTGPPTSTWYECNIAKDPGDNPRMEIYLTVDGEGSTVAYPVTVTVSVGDVYRCEIDGSNINFYQNGELKLSGTDTTLSSGRVGLAVYGSSSASIGDIQIENFSGGDLVPPSAATYWVNPAASGQHCVNSISDPGVANSSQTITQGLGCLSGGDTLILKNGTYSATGYAIDMNNIPSGTALAPTIIKAENNKQAILQGTGDGVINMVGFKSYITYDGLVADGNNAANFPLTGNEADHIRFTNGEVKNGLASGVLSSSTNLEVSNSLIHDNGTSAQYDHGLYLSGTNFLIEHNEIYNNAAFGIHLYPDPTGAIVRYNIVHNNNRGLIAYDADHQIYGNIFYAHATGGITLHGSSSNAIVYNNTVYDSGPFGISIEAGASGAIVKNNAFTFNTENFVDNATGTTKSNNFCTTSGGTTNCSVSAGSPGFADAPSADFRLCTAAGVPHANCAGQSALVDAGTPLGSPYNIDIVNTIRPQGAQWDIGAYEAEYGAVIFYVQNGGSGANCTDYSSLSTPAPNVAAAAACVVADRGDAIEVRAGTYTPASPAALPAATSYAGGVTLRNYSGETVVFNGMPIATFNSSTAYFTLDGGNGCTGRCIVIDGQDGVGGWLAGIPIGQGPNHIRLWNLEIKGWGASGILGGDDVDGTCCIEIDNAKIYNGGTTAFDNAVYVASQGFVIKNSEITNYSGAAIQIYGSASTSGTRIYNNLIHHTSGGGPRTSNNDPGGFTDEARIQGIVITGGNDILVWNNIVRDMTTHINGSTPVCCGGIDLFSATLTNSRVYSNTVYNTVTNGISCQAGTPSSQIIRNNIAYQNTAANIVNDCSATEDHNLTTNPAFTDPNTGDLTLLSNSPAINQGADLGTFYNADYAGRARPQGAQWDIGAYEALSVLSTRFFHTYGQGYSLNDAFAEGDCVATPRPTSEIAYFDIWNGGGGYYNGTNLWALCWRSGSLNSFQAAKALNPNFKAISYIMGAAELPQDYYMWRTPYGFGLLPTNIDWIRANHGNNDADRWTARGLVFGDEMTTSSAAWTLWMRIASPNWRTFWATQSYAWWQDMEAHEPGVEGIFSDNSFPNIGGHNGPWYQYGHVDDESYRDIDEDYSTTFGGPRDYQTWFINMMAFINATSAYLGARGLIYVPNFDNNGVSNSDCVNNPIGCSPVIWAALDASTNPPYAALAECPFVCGWGSNPIPPEADWKSFVDIMASLQHTRMAVYNNDTGRIGPALANMDDTAWGNNTGWDDLWFALTSFLQGYDPVRGNAMFAFVTRDPTFFFDEYKAEFLHLGTPVGAYSKVGNLYLREYTDGWVVTNVTASSQNGNVPSGQARVINHGNFKNAQAEPLVTQFSVPAYRGIILLKDGKSITNSDNSDQVVRYVIPSAGSTGCSHGSTNYNPTTNSCGTGSATVYIASDQANLKTAVEATQPGDRLEFRAGTYGVSFDANDMTFNSGASYVNAPVFARYQAEAVVFNGGPFNIPAPSDLGQTNIKYVIFDGFIIDALGDSVNAAVNFWGNVDHIRFTNGEIKNTTLARSCVSFQANTSDVKPSFIEITHSKIYDCGVGGSGSGTTGHGLYVGADNNLFDHLEVYNFGDHGIQVYSSALSPNSNTISNSIFRDGGTGTDIDGSAVVIYGQDNRVFNNLIYRNTGDGITVHGNSGQIVYNNSIYDNRDAVNIISSTAPAIKNNIIYGNTGQIVESGGSGFDYAKNLCGSAGTGCEFTGDPLFANPAQGDFTLQSGSPAINQGADLGSEYDSDYAGISRPQGAQWDIGAYEFIEGGFGIGVANARAYEYHCGENCALVLSPNATGPRSFRLPMRGKGLLRVGLAATSGDPPSTSFALYYDKNGGADTLVPTRSTGNEDLSLCPAPNITNGQATSQQITSGTFVAGVVRTTSAPVTIDLPSNGRSELLYSLCLGPNITTADRLGLKLKVAGGGALTNTAALALVPQVPRNR